MSSKSQQNAATSLEEPVSTTRGFKLGISKKTGRLVWCPACNCKWIFFVISATFVPIVLLLLLLSYLDSTAATVANDENTRPLRDELVKPCAYVRPILPEVIEVEERELLQDTRTSFIPPDLVVASDNCRQSGPQSSEEADDEDNGVADYDYEDTDDLVVPVRRRLRRHLNITDYDFDETSNSEEAEVELVWTTTKGTEPPPLNLNEAQKLMAAPTTPAPQMKNFWKHEENFENIRNRQAQVMMSHMDTTINPCDDFYQYACGNWEKNNQIPMDKAGYDTFEMLRETLDMVLQELLLEPSKPPVGELLPNTLDNRQMEANLRRRIVKRKTVLNKLIVRHQRTRKLKRRNVVAINPEDDAELKAKHLFLSCINHEGLVKRGLQPLMDLLDSLGGWPVLSPEWKEENFDWLNLTAQLRLFNNDIFIVEWVGPDIKNSEENAIQFDQTSLGLPTR
jgi:neprilysin